ncbi:MAG TPA: hypothetical protein VFM03_07470 [Candidatus Limnocylindria bacterium]|jgi:hypothetical protein|nr:hypothetical protein [Candidatus Limnocylindria bacterium]
MHDAALRGAVEELPAYHVCGIQRDRARQVEGHDHVLFVETRDPDGGQTRWRCVDVIAAMRDGERFVLGEGEDRRQLEPALCTACAFATVRVIPSDDADEDAYAFGDVHSFWSGDPI